MLLIIGSIIMWLVFGVLYMISHWEVAKYPGHPSSSIWSLTVCSSTGIHGHRKPCLHGTSRFRSQWAFTFDVVCVKWLWEVGGLEITIDYYRLLKMTRDYYRLLEITRAYSNHLISDPAQLYASGSSWNTRNTIELLLVGLKVICLPSWSVQC